jgi:hypothetical protein
MNSNLNKINPLRRPAWRYERVCNLLGHRPRPLAPAASDDRPTHQYYEFLSALPAAQDDDERIGGLYEAQPDVSWAHQTFFHEPLLSRQILEACLLTNEPFPEIAHRIGTTTSAVAAFEALFFNVRDRLQSRDWIYLAVLKPPAGSTAAGEMTDELRGHAYRFLGYFGGPVILDAALDCGISGPTPRDPRGALTHFQNMTDHGGLVQATMAMFVLPVDSKTLFRWDRQLRAKQPALNEAERKENEDRDRRLFDALVGLQAAKTGKPLDDFSRYG